MIVRKGPHYIPSLVTSKTVLSKDEIEALKIWCDNQRAFYEQAIKLYHNEEYTRGRFKGKLLTVFEAINVAKKDMGVLFSPDLFNQEMLNMFIEGIKRKRPFNSLCN